MKQNPPPPGQLAGLRLKPPHQPGQHEPGPALPATPAVVPMLPTRVRAPGRHAPLPDMVAVRQLAVPDPAPRYDDEVAVGKDDLYAGNEAIIGTPAAEPLDADQAGQQRPDPGSAEDGTSGPGPGAQSGSSQGPDPASGWPSQFAQVLAETLAGSRPAHQLTPWTTEQARRRIRELSPMLATDQRPRVRRVMTSAPAAGVLEMTAVVGFGPRVRVLALRLEREQARPYRQGGSRWCCTAIESA
jgi:hypothetical protein